MEWTQLEIKISELEDELQNSKESRMMENMKKEKPKCDNRR